MPTFATFRCALVAAVMAVGVASTPGSAAATSVDRLHTAAVTTPSAPTATTAQRGNHSVRVTWQAPVDDGGSPLTGYLVQLQTGTGPWVDATTTTSATATTAGGLTNGVGYRARVVALNALGRSEPSEPSETVTPLGPPAAPTAVTATTASGTVTLAWSAPGESGGSPITGYRIQRQERAGAWRTVVGQTGGPQPSYTFSGLPVGVGQRFRVAAVSTVGVGDWSVASAAVVPFAPPGAPGRLFVTTLGKLRVTASWRAAAANGADVTYLVQYSIGKRWRDRARTTGLSWRGKVKSPDTGNTVRFRIIAVNAAGPGPAGPVTKVSIR